MENYNDIQEERPKLNPFLSVWLHPKQTARYMINDKTIGFAILILSIGSISTNISELKNFNNLDFFPFNYLPDVSPWILMLLCVIFAPVFGIIGTAFSALISWLLGKLFKGTGTFSELFKGLSLTTIPSIILIPFYVIWLLTSPETLFDLNYISGAGWIFWILLMFVSFAVNIWSIVIMVGVIAEVHQISNWNAFFIFLIPVIIIIILFVFLFLIVAGMFIGMS